LRYGPIVSLNIKKYMFRGGTICCDVLRGYYQARHNRCNRRFSPPGLKSLFSFFFS
jgi:hypothetical protein